MEKEKVKVKGIKGYLENYKKYTIWRIIAFFIIYSVLGYLIESIYGFVFKGVWESRKSFLYGPFCGIYGVGAVLMILALNPYQKNKHKLFFWGFIVGSIVEFGIGALAEAFFHVKWWDYSNMPLNIGGKVCVYFSLFWGLLATYLVSYLNPKIDKLLDFIKTKISKKILIVIEITVTIFLVFDMLATAYALKVFYVRTVVEKDIKVINRTSVDEEYNKIYGNEFWSGLINKFWGNEKMVKTFPNLKLHDENNETLYFDSFYKEVQPYYFKIKK